MKNVFNSIRLPPICFCLSLFVLVFTSCDREWPDDICNCTHGGSIDGWDDGDETDINQKDSTAGFEIDLKNWSDTCQSDLVL